MGGWGRDEGCYLTQCSFFLGGMERTQVTVDLTVFTIPDWLIKIVSGRLKWQLDQVLSRGLVSWALGASDPILGVWFSL